MNMRTPEGRRIVVIIGLSYFCRKVIIAFPSTTSLLIGIQQWLNFFKTNLCKAIHQTSLMMISFQIYHIILVVSIPSHELEKTYVYIWGVMQEHLPSSVILELD